MRFGGERVIKLMQTMGMSETEVIRHDMITKSIQNAQNKTMKKINYEQKSKSAEEWYRLNFPQS
jgi:preprotein translocase subunit SecA